MFSVPRPGHEVQACGEQSQGDGQLEALRADP